MTTLVMICGYLICGIVGLIGVAILWLIFNGTIDLSRLISEPTGDASMGRLQFLIFTFVISLSLFLVIVSAKDRPTFPESIPGGILTLLGISGSSYAVGKAIQFSDPAGIEDRPVTVTIAPSTATVRYGQTQQFSADLIRKPDAKVRWEVTAGRGSINADTGLYRAPDVPLPAPAPAPVAAPAPLPGPGPAALAAQAPDAHEHATIKVTCVDYSDVSDLAVVTMA
jgi:hypothetical protein